VSPATTCKRIIAFALCVAVVLLLVSGAQGHHAKPEVYLASQTPQRPFLHHDRPQRPAGYPMRLDQIEDLVAAMKQPKIAQTLREEDLHGDHKQRQKSDAK
jgi:hypothetical protein